MSMGLQCRNITMKQDFSETAQEKAPKDPMLQWSSVLLNSTFASQRGLWAHLEH